MALFDLLGRRWAMGVLWTVCENNPAPFGRLQQLCESISPTVLSQRLKDLQEARLLTRTLKGYAPTELGARVHQELVPLGATAKVWSTALQQDEQDVQ